MTTIESSYLVKSNQIVESVNLNWNLLQEKLGTSPSFYLTCNDLPETQLSGLKLQFSFDRERQLFIDSTGTYSGLTTGSITCVGGKIGSAYFIAGSPAVNTNKVTVTNNSNLQISGALTISMWLYPLDLSLRTNPIHKEYRGEYTITQEINGTLNFYNGSRSVYKSISSAGSLTANEWNHIAIVREAKGAGTIGSAFWYMNGSLTNTSTTIYQSGCSPCGSNVIIGNGYVGSAYPGYIDDLRIYNTQLNGSEIAAIYNNGNGTNNNTSTLLQTATIISGTYSNVGAYPCSFISGPKFVEGKLGSAYQFNGSTSYLDFGPRVGSLIASNKPEWAVSCWVNYIGSSLGPSGGTACIFGGRTGDNVVVIVNTNLTVAMKTDDSQATTSAAVITPGSWQHLIFNYSIDIDAGSPYWPYWECYSNGSLVYAGSYNYKTGNPSTQGQFFIGHESRSKLTWNGLIDDFRIYDTNLSQVAVNALYNNGSGTTELNPTTSGGVQAYITAGSVWENITAYKNQNYNLLAPGSSLQYKLEIDDNVSGGISYLQLNYE